MSIAMLIYTGLSLHFLPFPKPHQYHYHTKVISLFFRSLDISKPYIPALFPIGQKLEMGLYLLHERSRSTVLIIEFVYSSGDDRYGQPTIIGSFGKTGVPNSDAWIFVFKNDRPEELDARKQFYGAASALHRSCTKLAKSPTYWALILMTYYSWQCRIFEFAT
ncbi:uncharacterized protein LOC131241542 [Magnolia sinica]|uniref:uncharacterized protein LOC131241542 n=1 Tax=Magnolia sinica TaxID=86752 RepID=UPI002658B589|nr:uncharacterized protein LOC131241542 [Magnolia sinica]